MANISITGRFTPLRMILARREPVRLAVYIKNNGEEEKKLTVKTILSPQLAFTKGGFKNAELKRIDSIKPGEEKTFYFELHPKAGTREGEHDIRIRVQEHYSNFQYTQRQHEETFALLVE